MSLGWQTESALLPSKATPITVDSKSMIGLKAAVFEGEQKINSRGKRSISELRQLQQQSQAGSRADEIATNKNKGVSSRNARDEAAHIDETQKEDKVVLALRAKSELYDKIKEGEVAVDASSCLVKFSVDNSKRKPEESSAEERPPLAVAVSVSVAHPSWNWSRGAEADMGTDAPDSGQVSTAQDYKRRKLSEMTFMARVKEELSSKMQEQAKETGTATLSGGARVKSQWEKTLTGTSKELLEQIHQETERGRTIGAGDGDQVFEPTVHAGGFKSAREQRLQMIREKQEALKKSRDKSGL